jgi:membrane protein DedA with SNARE-associated domain
VTGGATIVGVVAGAGLTYWLGTLNRRHQERRGDKTRWYEARLQAYVQLNQAATDMTALLFREQKPSSEERHRAMAAL